MLVLENVKKQYDKFELDCSLQVKKGMITGLIGKNGSGKTTTFKLALGLIGQDQGRLEILGKNARELTIHDRREIGVVLADSGFSGYLSIKDIVPMLSAMYPKFHKELFLQRCETFQLPLNKKIKEFSTGMKRKLQLLVAISYEARLLILDEPTAGMDVIARDEMLDLLRGYMEEEDRAILISSHISGDLENLCDDLYMIDEGQIVMHEETDVLYSDYAVLKLTKEQYEQLDQTYVLRRLEERYGYRCLTNQRQFYAENYPEIEIENGNIDEVMTMMIRGEK